MDNEICIKSKHTPIAVEDFNQGISRVLVGQEVKGVYSTEFISHLLSKIPEVGGSLEKLEKGFISLHGKFKRI